MTEKKSWFTRLTEGLKKSSDKITQGVSEIFTRKKLDEETLQSLEDLLIMADLGVEVAASIVKNLRSERFGKDITGQEIKEFLSQEIAKMLEPVAVPLTVSGKKPFVLLMVGVNGSGKTTTCAKLAQQWKEEGLQVSMAACDTFRAAAVEQLRVWGDRLGIPVAYRDTGADAAGLAYDAYTDAKARGDDVLLIDTAGRLHNNVDLMNELAKIVRVLKKQEVELPHACALVLDATGGQNIHNQVETFGRMVDVTGLILTKLDGTAKGGVLVALANRFKKPVYALGVGEKPEDLRPFNAKNFADSLVGLSLSIQ
ncbi:MAG: signal recognition particle-docking protein FtsY [Alphaproteobacteria bacterium]|nr:signal recognition particle-docking protein FtsY [Alphaproteobacteria bacterium]